jgi:diadenosine tetraphosphate (Ap4A) HIT family hydrolase
VSLDQLWAGWRSEYVGSDPLPPDADSERNASVAGDDPAHCVFCRIVASGDPSPDNGVIWRGSTVLAVLNAYPYASGHLMVLPLRHVRAMADLTDDESTELWSALRRGVEALETAYSPEGVNLGANLGRAAGAGIPRHLHLHAVPRWVGDTNFMTTVAGVRVLPEVLPVSWERLHRAWPPDT